MVGQENNNLAQSKRGISGSTLKIIALITMLIDHIGAVVVVRMIFDNAAKMGMTGAIPYDNLYMIYLVMRLIGRIAFPIYCFLLVEGFQRTHSKASYAMRLGAFALISEIPFDLAFNSKFLEFGYQNVFFTLFVGFLTMIAVDAVGGMKLEQVASSKKKVVQVLQWVSCFGIVAVGAVIAELMHTDYGALGVLCIMLLYLFRRTKRLQLIAGCISFVWDSIAPLAFIPIAFYNGKKGMNLKYIFYLFYPLHLLILYLICVAMGLNGYSAI